MLNTLYKWATSKEVAYFMYTYVMLDILTLHFNMLSASIIVFLVAIIKEGINRLRYVIPRVSNLFICLSSILFYLIILSL